jgi:hypothetical protein
MLGCAFFCVQGILLLGCMHDVVYTQGKLLFLACMHVVMSRSKCCKVVCLILCPWQIVVSLYACCCVHGGLMLGCALCCVQSKLFLACMHDVVYMADCC